MYSIHCPKYLLFVSLTENKTFHDMRLTEFAAKVHLGNWIYEQTSLYMHEKVCACFISLISNLCAYLLLI